MITWPNEVVSSIARRRSVLFLGAGVSMNSKNDAGASPPSWKEFLEKAILRCPAPHTEMKKLLNNGDYLTCCQIAKYKLNHDWVPFVEEMFLTPQFKHNDLHTAILGLDSSVVLTPNLDKIYDNYAQSKTSNLLKIKKFYDDDIPRALRGGENQRLILKIHGCIDTPDKLVFTREDYADIRNKNANFYRAIDSLVLTHTFLFLGCGMNDPDLSLVLEQYARSFASAPPHYIAFSGKISDEYGKMLQNNYNLRILQYSPTNNHQELLESVKDLSSLVEVKRQELSNSYLW
ncbi:SIR2 family protein [Azospirillum sp. BE72]|uniref:SIR2 family NAD-dependent protein deacylase n=1 Tax=Azospirillum sp. BE72 TaxID=2817776 RepID=UPI00286305DA|nr:SIR2 family protein [Azospirillum sp. BE72]MDR6770434.1 hypothetical protein [Azospirillum sp. BE72]